LLIARVERGRSPGSRPGNRDGRSADGTKYSPGVRTPKLFKTSAKL
jgi:hypothetical protein